MTNEPPKVTATGHYSASEAIKLLGISRSKFYYDVKKDPKVVVSMVGQGAITDAYNLPVKKLCGTGVDNLQFRSLR